MTPKVAVALVGLGAALLVGSVMYAIEAWLYGYRSDAWWVSGIGAGLLASGLAGLFQRSQP
jgi:hypothetical protein